MQILPTETDQIQKRGNRKIGSSDCFLLFTTPAYDFRPLLIRLKIPWPKGREGSTPSSGTREIAKANLLVGFFLLA
jgi:hypothetical protein